jgi:hypothetical protein
MEVVGKRVSDEGNTKEQNHIALDGRGLARKREIGKWETHGFWLRPPGISPSLPSSLSLSLPPFLSFLPSPCGLCDKDVIIYMLYKALINTVPRYPIHFSEAAGRVSSGSS